MTRSAAPAVPLARHLGGGACLWQSPPSTAPISTTVPVGAAPAPLLFLHGQLNEARGMFPFADRLSAERGVLWAALDLPGHGDAVVAAEAVAGDTLPRSIGEALDTLGWSSVDVVAHSLGGWALLDALIAGEPRVRRAVLIGCPHDLTESARAEFEGFAQLLETAGFVDDLVGVALQRWYGHRDGSAPASFHDVVRTQLHRNDPVVAAAVFRWVNSRAATAPHLPKLRGRVAVVVAEDDVIVGDDEAQTMAALLDTPLRRCPGSHFPFVDHLDACTDVVIKALDDVADNSGSRDHGRGERP